MLNVAKTSNNEVNLFQRNHSELKRFQLFWTLRFQKFVLLLANYSATLVQPAMIGHLLQVGRTGVLFLLCYCGGVNIVACSYTIRAVKYVILAASVVKFSPIPGHITPKHYRSCSIWKLLSAIINCRKCCYILLVSTANYCSYMLTAVISYHLGCQFIKFSTISGSIPAETCPIG